MSINKKVELSWKGKKHNLLITMRHVDEIESDFNLILFANQLNNGDCRYSKLSWLLAKFLRMAGAEATQDEVWSEMFGGGTALSPVDALVMAREITAACLPEAPKTKSTAKKKPAKKSSKK